jgi:hypothetical protein
MGEELRRVMESWKGLLGPGDLDPVEPEPLSLNPETFKEPYHSKHYTANDAAKELRQLMGEGSTIFGRRLRCSADSILQFEKDKWGLRPSALERLEALAREKFPDRKDIIEALADGAAIARGRAMKGGWWHDPGEHAECTNAYEDPLPQPRFRHPTQDQATTLKNQAELLMNSPAWKGHLKAIKRVCESYESAAGIMEQLDTSPIRVVNRKMGEDRFRFPLSNLDRFIADYKSPDVNLGVEVKPPPKEHTAGRSTEMQPERAPSSDATLLSPGEACKALRDWLEEGQVLFSRRVAIKPASLSRFESGKQSLRPIALERLLALAHETLPTDTSIATQIIALLSWAVIGAWKRVEERGGWGGDRKPKPVTPPFHFLTKLQLQSFRSNLHLSVDAFPWRSRLVGLRRLCESYLQVGNILVQFRDGPVKVVADPEISDPYDFPWDEVTAFTRDYQSHDSELGLAVGVVVNAETGEPVPPRRRRDTSEY